MTIIVVHSSTYILLFSRRILVRPVAVLVPIKRLEADVAATTMSRSLPVRVAESPHLRTIPVLSWY